MTMCSIWPSSLSLVNLTARRTGHQACSEDWTSGGGDGKVWGGGDGVGWGDGKVWGGGDGKVWGGGDGKVWGVGGGDGNVWGGVGVMGRCGVGWG